MNPPSSAPRLEDRLTHHGGCRWLLIIVVCLLAVQVKWWWIPGRDSSAYLSIARNLVDGRIERLGSEHLHFAPGYPLVLAPAFFISERPFFSIAIIHFGLALLLLLGIIRWIREIIAKDARTNGAAAVLLTSFIMLNAGLWHYYREALSEIAFITELIWATLFLRKVMSCATLGRTIGWGVGAMILIALASITRQVGVFLVAGFGVVMLLRAIKGQSTWTRAIAAPLLIGLPVALVVGALILWDQGRAIAASQAGGYLAYVVDDSMSLPAQLLEGLRLRISEVGRLLVPGMLRAYADTGEWLHINTILYSLFSIAIGTGWWRMARRSADPMLYTFPFYVAFFIAWPFDQGTRYMLPMLPVLVLCVWAIVGRWPRHRLSIVFILAVIHGMVSIGDWFRTFDAEQLHDRWPEIESIADVIIEPKGDIATLHLSRDITLMLAFELNAMVGISDPSDEALEEVEWLIMPADSEETAGFVSAWVGPTLDVRRRITLNPSSKPMISPLVE